VKFAWNPQGPLAGAAVFLSASVPDVRRHPRYLEGPVDDLLLMNRVIDLRALDAVRCLVAQVLRAGGRVLHGGHPTITQAIACHLHNWDVGPQGEGGVDPLQKPVVLYQSELFQALPAPPGREAMARAGFAALRWTPPLLEAASLETASLEAASLEAASFGGQPLLAWLGDHGLEGDWLAEMLPQQAPAPVRKEGMGEAEFEQAQARCDSRREALLVMRLLMLLEAQPRLCLCIGGMEGIEAEAQLYLQLVERGLLRAEPRVHVLASTYGAAVQLTDARAQLLEEPHPEPTNPETAVADLLRRLSYDETMRAFVADSTALLAR
jgi:hypothetical protein